jgi:hypothetical protein
MQANPEKYLSEKKGQKKNGERIENDHDNPDRNPLGLQPPGEIHVFH